MMNTKIVILFFSVIIIIFQTIFSCNLKQKNENSSIATYPGGADSMNSFFSKTINWYIANKDIEGTVIVEFFVNSDGSISEPIILKGLCEICDAEILRVLRLMPAWHPAKKGNNLVKSKIIVPIIFMRPKS